MLARAHQRCPYGKRSVRQCYKRRMVEHTSSIQGSSILEGDPVAGDGGDEGDYYEDFFDENSRH